MRKPWIALLALCAFAALVAGCGGGNDGESASSTLDSKSANEALFDYPPNYLNRAEFVKRGHEICDIIAEEIEADFERFSTEHQLEAGSRPTQAELTEISEEITLPLYRKQMYAFRHANQKGDVAAEAESFILAMNKAWEEGEKEPSRATSDPAEVFAVPNQKAEALTLDNCVRDEPIVG